MSGEPVSGEAVSGEAVSGEPATATPRVPDVTVIVAVYNTMPYLTACLDSLVEQTIGLDRLEVIAVDDGSTDGSGAELDRYAERYPGTVHVIHQPNSGGPAAPSNRALERATGRYVFFVGADDYLGREALERLVAAADRYGSDVTLGRLVGVNGRFVHQGIYSANQPDVSVFDSSLPWSMSNTKLFRRTLIEAHGLRFPEDMPMLSDQPFTIEACVRAGRICVLADYEYYYAVRRLDASNITFVPRHEELLRCTTRLMDFVADLVQPGKEREALHLRHFSWEVAKLLRADLLELDRPTQERVVAGVRRLTAKYLTDDVRARVRAYKRILLGLADRGDVDGLLDFIRRSAGQDQPHVVVEGDRWYAAYPGFRDPERALPDSWFDITAHAAEWLARMEAVSARWEGGRSLLVTARSPYPQLAQVATAPIHLTAGGVAGSVVDTVPDDAGTTVRVRFDVPALLAGGDADRRRSHPVRVRVEAFGGTGSAPLQEAGAAAARRLVHRVGTRLFSINPVRSKSGRLVIAVTPITLRRVAGGLRRKLSRGGRGFA